MENYITREISLTSDDEFFKVSKMVTSKGDVFMSICAGDTFFRLDGLLCQQKACDLAKMIEKVATDPCDLPIIIDRTLNL